MTDFIGPRVPEDIQAIRKERRRAALAEVESDAPHKNEETRDEPSDSSSSDDDEYGPMLPQAGREAEEEEEEAMRRLTERAHASGATEGAAKDSRADWLNVALGVKPKKPVKRPFADGLSRLDRHAKRKTEAGAQQVTDQDNEDRPSLLEEHMASRPKRNPDEIDFDRDVRGGGSGNRHVAELLKGARDMSSRFKRAG